MIYFRFYHGFICGLVALFYMSSMSHAFLLVTPAHTYHNLLWERVLIVFDPMTEQQTTITQIAISGSPKSFAILIPVRKEVDIHYTTTSIWRALEQQMKISQTHRREIKIYPYSWLFKHLIPNIGHTRKDSFKRNVLRSKDTLIHAKEIELHQWLLSRGLLLNTSSALSVKKVYQQGKVIACLWVTPPTYKTSANKAHQRIQNTLSSTWIFTMPTHEPFYDTLYPSSLAIDSVSKTTTSKLELTLLNEWKAQIEWNQERSSQGVLSYYQANLFKTIDRFHVNRLNNKLRSTQWSFRRSGLLSKFEMKAPQGYQTLYFKPQKKYEATRKKTVKIKRHDFYISIELGLLILWVLWWFWFRYATNKKSNTYL